MRRKFQKSPAHDTNEVLKTVSSLALAHPDVSFELVAEQESLLRAKVSREQSIIGQRSERSMAVLRLEFLKK